MTNADRAGGGGAGCGGGRRINWALALIAAFNLPVGVQAALVPRSFFDGFPAGRGWIAAGDAAYDEHLVRDVGVLFLALVLVTAWVAVTRTAERAVAAAWLLQGLAHLVFHASHLDGLSRADGVSLLISLAAVPVLALVAWRQPSVAIAMGRRPNKHEPAT
ncbi:MAG: hypothetical protein R2761_24440 [Acidimicrobiales bacterium]